MAIDCARRLIFQLSGLLYNTVRPQFLAQKDLEVLCEVIQVLRSEVIEAAITPRAVLVGYAEPVMHRMIQDAQERLILCMQKYIRDEIEGFVPTPADLDYPAKLVTAEQAGVSLYATWYPSLEHTLLCLSKGYHFVKVSFGWNAVADGLHVEALIYCYFVALTGHLRWRFLRSWRRTPFRSAQRL